jgi:hypothetical protein
MIAVAVHEGHLFLAAAKCNAIYCIQQVAGIKIKPSGDENIKGDENHVCGGRDIRCR